MGGEGARSVRTRGSEPGTARGHAGTLGPRGERGRGYRELAAACTGQLPTAARFRATAGHAVPDGVEVDETVSPGGLRPGFGTEAAAVSCRW